MIGLVTEGPAQLRVCDQLDGVGVAADVVADERGIAGVLQQLEARLRDLDQAVLLISGRVLLHDEAICDLVLDPRERTAAAVSRVRGPSDVRRRGGQVVSAGSPLHAVSEPDAAFARALMIGRRDLPAAATAVGDMAALLPPDAPGDPISYVLVALARSGIHVAAVGIDPWPWARAAEPAEVAAFDESTSILDAPATKLARALRPDDGFYSTFVVRRLSRRLTPIALRLGLRPNQITIASLLIGLLAAGSFALGGRTGLVVGAVLLQLSLVVDCVDGEVARYLRAFSAVGAWLDASTDRIKEYACYAGLAYGATAANGVDPWLLAATMLSLQTTRHTTDYTFTLVKNVREGAAIFVPLGQREDVRSDGNDASVAVRAVRASERSNERPVVKWAKKAMYMPIGERWLVISLAAAFGSAYWVFGALLTLGSLALVYTTAARVLRSRTWTAEAPSELERQVVRAQLDRGPLASAIARLLPWRLPVGRLAWSMPPLLRALEFGCVVLLVRRVAPEAMPAAFALLFVVAYHHYDALYRVLNGVASAGALRLAGLGVEGRLLVLAALVATGADALARGLVVLAIALGLLFLGVGTAGGLRALRSSSAQPSRGKAIGV